MNKSNTFESAFSEPAMSSEGGYVLSRECYLREEAAEVFSECLGEDIKPEGLTKDRVRFGLFNIDGEIVNAWSTCGKVKGSKKVWTV